MGRYCSEGAAFGGTPCPAGFTTDSSGAKSFNECGCPEGTYYYYYKEAASRDAGTIICEPCNQDMNCTVAGLSLATVPLRPSEPSGPNFGQLKFQN